MATKKAPAKPKKETAPKVKPDSFDEMMKRIVRVPVPKKKDA